MRRQRIHIADGGRAATGQVTIEKKSDLRWMLEPADPSKIHP
jgi:hypothetical protein